MELNVNTAKCLTIVAAAALGMCSSPRAQACGEQWGNRGLAAFGFPALMIESQASPSFAPGSDTFRQSKSPAGLNRGHVDRRLLPPRARGLA